MKYLIIFILLSSCSFSDYDFNPSTTILKQLIKEMTKKRKLNSKNPIYNKVEKKIKYKRVFVKEIKGCKIYNLYEIF